MSNVVEKAAAMLMAQLARLDALAVAAGDEMGATVEQLKAECERSKAVNDTARNIIGLGDLHLRAEMLRSTPDRPFSPGIMFADGEADGLLLPAQAHTLPAAQAEAAPSEEQGGTTQATRPRYAPFGGRTKMNEMGEFVTDDGLDAFTGGG